MTRANKEKTKAAYKNMPNIDNDDEMAALNSEYIDRINAIVAQQGEMSEDERENARFTRPKKTACTERIKMPESQPIITANKLGFLETKGSTHKSTWMSITRHTILTQLYRR